MQLQSGSDILAGLVWPGLVHRLTRVGKSGRVKTLCAVQSSTEESDCFLPHAPARVYMEKDFFLLHASAYLL
jgi:hypothetical protein